MGNVGRRPHRLKSNRCVLGSRRFCQQLLLMAPLQAFVAVFFLDVEDQFQGLGKGGQDKIAGLGQIDVVQGVSIMKFKRSEAQG